MSKNDKNKATISATKQGNVSDSRVDSDYLNMLRSALDVGVSILDEDMNYCFLSDAMYDQLHIASSDLKVGDPLERCHELMIKNGMLDPDFIEKNRLSANEQRERASRKDSPETHALMNLGDGSTHRFIRKVMDNGYTVSMSTNVSELVEKDKILEDALRLGHAGYWIWDIENQDLVISESLREEFSKEDHALIRNEGILAIIHPDDRPMFWRSLAHINNDNRVVRATVRITPRNGKERWHQLNAELLPDIDGNWNKVRAFVRDVTLYRQQSVALEKAKDEAIAASLAKSQFLANMSHEIRTPLNGVMGMAELLSRTNIDSRQKDFVDIITQSATQLLMIINDILDFSRVEAGEMRIDASPLNLKRALNDVAALIAPLARQKGLELIVNYPNDIPEHFLGDLGRIRQIITNLIGNSVKFTEQGHITVDVKFSEGNNNIGIIVLEVRDTGIGIPKEKIDNIFNKFTQVDNSTTRVHGGTGLGLSISKSLVELMNGRITVKSKLGEGSKFSVYLPLPYDPNAVTSDINPEIFIGKRALIVDDIDINRRILSEMLSGWGMTSVTSPDAFAAMEELKKCQTANTPFDIIVTDHLMPGMNGQEFAAAISVNESLAQTPVVMLSSCDRVISREELRAVGIDEYLVKPARSERLFETMLKMLSKEKLPAAKGSSYDDSLTERVHSPETPLEKGVINILVAEDLGLNQDVVRLMIEDTQFVPTFADNGKIALDLYSENPGYFGIVLMDISMPVMDGKEATQKIRDFEKSKACQPVPIIALTGHALKEDKQKFLDAGLDDYLSKPIKRGDLLRMLEKWVARGINNKAAVA